VVLLRRHWSREVRLKTQRAVGLSVCTQSKASDRSQRGLPREKFTQANVVVEEKEEEEEDEVEVEVEEEERDKWRLDISGLFDKSE
jgi:hypothetical protein